MNFLPDNYESPKGPSYYMKFQDGENRFRILSQPIFGWLDWKDKKPLRFKMDNKPAKPVDPKKPVKHFWAMVVWNHIEEQIQILEITQATIRKSIEALCKDTEWGAPYFYDMKIIKSGEGVDTEYMVNPVPHKPTHEHVINCFNERKINLEALFDSADPFSDGWEKYTSGIFNKDDVSDKKVSSEPIVSKEDAENLKKVLNECDPKYRDQVMSTLKKESGITSLENLTIKLYERIKTAALKKVAEFKSGQIEKHMQAVA